MKTWKVKDNLREENCKFYVNKEKRTITCVYAPERCSSIVWNDSYAFIDTVRMYDHDDLLDLKGHYAATAVCAPEDEWNECIGKRVAFLKVRKKFYKSYFNAVNKYITAMDKYMNNYVEIMNNFGARIENSIKHEEERLKEEIIK